jgi:hypothetical protein
MVIQILIWTCVAVFITTSIITLLGIINVLKIEKPFLNKLFYSLIIEIVAIVVFTFSEYLKNEKQPFVRITFPIDNFNLNGQNTLQVNGVAVLNINENQKISLISIIEKDTLYFETLKTTARDRFIFTIPIKEKYSNPFELKLQCQIIQDNKIILKDDEIFIKLNK